MKTDRSQVPSSSNPRAFNFPKFERFTLANGLEILHAPHTKLPLVTFQLINKKSALSEMPDQIGLTALTARMLLEGTQTKSVLDFSRALEYLAIDMNSSSSWDASYFSVNCLRKHLSRSIELFGEALFAPAFDEEELGRQKKQLLNSRISKKDDPSALASEIFAAGLFPDTRYARPLCGFIPDIKKIDKTNLKKTHLSNYQPQNCALIIVGDLASNEIDSNFKHLLDEWQQKTTEPDNPPKVTANPNGSVILLHKPGAMQAQIRVGHIGLNRHSPDYYDALLMNEILGGYFMSRLNMNLREDKGYTYGINSRFQLRKTAGPFVISAAVDAEKVLPALDEILLEMHKIQNENVADKELKDSRGYVSGIFPVAFESGPQIAGGLSNIELYDLDDNYYRNFRDHLNSVTIASIRSAAEKYLHPDSAVIVVVADRKVVESKLRKCFDQLQVVEISDD